MLKHVTILESCAFLLMLCCGFGGLILFLSPSDRYFITREGMEVVKKAELVGKSALGNIAEGGAATS